MTPSRMNSVWDRVLRIRALRASAFHCSHNDDAIDCPMEVKPSPLVFIKLGGSLVTDKTKPETLREEVLDQIARWAIGLPFRVDMLC